MSEELFSDFTPRAAQNEKSIFVFGKNDSHRFLMTFCVSASVTFLLMNNPLEEWEAFGKGFHSIFVSLSILHGVKATKDDSIEAKTARWLSPCWRFRNELEDCKRRSAKCFVSCSTTQRAAKICQEFKTLWKLFAAKKLESFFFVECSEHYSQRWRPKQTKSDNKIDTKEAKACGRNWNA